MQEKLDKLLGYVQSDGRVCPMPNFWDELFRMLPDRGRTEGWGQKPSAPLILAAWWDTSARLKRERLGEHIKWAADHGVLDKIDAFIRGLTVDQWAYGDGTTSWDSWGKRKVNSSKTMPPSG